VHDGSEWAARGVEFWISFARLLQKLKALCSRGLALQGRPRSANIIFNYKSRSFCSTRERNEAWKQVFSHKSMRQNSALFAVRAALTLQNSSLRRRRALSVHYARTLSADNFGGCSAMWLNCQRTKLAASTLAQVLAQFQQQIFAISCKRTDF
jgi:hypothetical protein